MSWVYAGTDPGLALFTACLKAGAPMPFETCARVLEVGCCEANWLSPAAKAWPDAAFVGIDTRKTQDAISIDGRITRMRADALNTELFEPESFDAVVSLSAIEHIGLGHYGDPIDPDGDSKALANIWRWLKPGGFVYFDVPYDPTRYYLKGTKCRVYDDAALDARLLHGRRAWAMFVTATEPSISVEKPTNNVVPFHYCAMVIQKPHSPETSR